MQDRPRTDAQNQSGVLSGHQIEAQVNRTLCRLSIGLGAPRTQITDIGQSFIEALSSVENLARDQLGEPEGGVNAAEWLKVDRSALEDYLKCGVQAELDDFFDSFILPLARTCHSSIVRNYVVLDIDHHFMDPDISLHAVASRVGHSPSHFCTVFSEATGRTFKGYLTDVRIKGGKELLRTTSLRTAEFRASLHWRPESVRGAAKARLRANHRVHAELRRGGSMVTLSSHAAVRRAAVVQE